jgi:uncharacterized membrane protein YeaQ/YmgE (transglycosylase-associated protein family)
MDASPDFSSRKNWARVGTLLARRLAEVAMSVIGWIILGGLAGWIGSLLINKTGEGLFLDIVLGIVGGVVGGWLMAALGSTGVTGFNMWSLFVAVVGAIVVLLIKHAVVRTT